MPIHLLLLAHFHNSAMLCSLELNLLTFSSRKTLAASFLAVLLILELAIIWKNGGWCYSVYFPYPNVILSSSPILMLFYILPLSWKLFTEGSSWLQRMLDKYDYSVSRSTLRSTKFALVNKDAEIWCIVMLAII